MIQKWVGDSQVFFFPFILLSVAFFSLYERKVMGLIQTRKGPNKVFQGFGQPFSDAMKLISKSETRSEKGGKSGFFLAPIFMFFMSSLFWIFFPLPWGGQNSPLWGVIILSIYSVLVYGLIFIGWVSNSKFSCLGAIRSIVQSLSYEVGLSFIVVMVFILVSSLSFSGISHFQESSSLFLSLSPLFFLGVVTILAELNRSPFDLTEGESELVSGFNVEYGGLSYTFVFLSENLSLLWSSVFVGSLFSPFVCPLFIWLSVWVRATEPRIRYDKMMELFWVVILPFIIGSGSLALSAY